jgi:hypothetical protein
MRVPTCALTSDMSTADARGALKRKGRPFGRFPFDFLFGPWGGVLEAPALGATGESLGAGGSMAHPWGEPDTKGKVLSSHQVVSSVCTLCI